MSLGNTTDDQENYNAMLQAAQSFIAKANSISMQNVQVQPSDCDILAALILAAQRVYNERCPIV